MAEMARRKAFEPGSKTRRRAVAERPKMTCECNVCKVFRELGLHMDTMSYRSISMSRAWNIVSKKAGPHCDFNNPDHLDEYRKAAHDNFHDILREYM